MKRFALWLVALGALGALGWGGAPNSRGFSGAPAASIISVGSGGGTGGGGSASCTTCTDNLEAYWSMDLQSDGGVEDLTGHGYSANVISFIGWDAGIINTGLGGISGNAFANLNVTSSTYPAAFAISTWVKASNNAFAGGYACLVCENTNEGLYIHNTKFDFYAAGADHEPSAGLAFGVWSHVVVNYSGTQMRFWVNGVQDATTFTFAISAPNFQVRTLACADNNYALQGVMDETAVYTRELTPTEIVYIYNDGGARSYASLQP